MLTAACGQKGDPLAPLRLVPSAVTDVSARRSGEEVELRFTLPATNANGPGGIDLAQVEIYAMTLAPGAVTPPNRELLSKAHITGTIAVKPPTVEGEAPKNTPPDKRPAAGDRATFVDQLTEAKLTPATATTPGRGSTPPPSGPPGATGELKPVPSLPKPAAQSPDSPDARPPGPDAQVAPAPVANYPVRIYAIRGISRGGRPGPPSARVSVPLVSPVAPPSSVVAQMPAENTVVVDWTPPLAEPGGTAPTFNVYRRDVTTSPMNQTPLTDVKFETSGVDYGKEICFVVRSVQTFQNVTVESDLSAPACLTPVDKFPPATPKGLRGVAEEGVVNLVWEANSEPDLGGYLVLRGEVEGGTLPQLTPQPIKDASYRDTSVKPGVRYWYAVVAVDTATPRNVSPPSDREAVTAR
jgi:hypothetical protein